MSMYTFVLAQGMNLELKLKIHVPRQPLFGMHGLWRLFSANLKMAKWRHANDLLIILSK